MDLLVSALGILLNALVSWALIFGHFGLPALGIFGGGLGSSIVWWSLCGALALVIAARPHSSAASICSAVSGGPTGRAFAMVRLGFRSALTMAFEGAVFAPPPI